MASMIKDVAPTGKVIESHKLIMVNADGNNNKYWNVFLHDSGDVFKQWGRVRTDADGSLKTTGSQSGLFQCGDIDSGRRKMESEMRGKFNKGYEEVRVVDSPGAIPSVSNGSLKQAAKEDIGGCPEVQKLIEFLVQVNVHQIEQYTSLRRNASGLFGTPFGVIDLEVIKEARTVLDEIAPFVMNKDWDSSSAKDTMTKFLRLIPHDMGARIDLSSVFANEKKLEAESDILDALEASYQAVMTAPVDDDKDATPRSKIFDVTLAKASVSRFNRVKKMFNSTKKSMHAASRLKVSKVWTVDMPTLKAKFDKKQAKLNGEVWELWHGTKASNLLSILKGGLIIPSSHSSHVTGRLFGNGVYASDQATKALNYAMGAAPGQSRTGLKRYFMFLCDMAMGKVGTVTSRSGRFPMPGCDSTFAKGGNRGLVYNNEMIVYSTDQVNLTHLVEFEG